MSKLGIHIDISTHDGQVEKLIAAKPSVIKVIASRGLLNSLHDALPDTTFIARIASTELAGDDFLRFLGNDSPQAAARRWYDILLPVLKEAPFAYWEAFNEMASWEAMYDYGLFEQERQNILADNGYKAAIGSFATGTPEIVPPNDRWPQFYPALAAAHRYHNLLSLHEYGGLFMDMWYDGDNYNVFPDTYKEGWLFTRYRQVWNKHIKPNLWTNIKIVLTEFGLDNAATSTVSQIAGKPIGPWKQCKPVWAEKFNRPDGEQFYFEQLVWADKQMQKDSYVVGATIFTHGTMSPVWGEFDIEGPVADKVYNHIKISVPGAPVPVPTPDPEMPPQEAYVQTTALSGQNIRETPSLYGKIVALARMGEAMLVLARQGDWTKVRTVSGIIGWAFSSYLVSFSVPVPPPAPTSLPGSNFPYGHALVGLHGPADPGHWPWDEEAYRILHTAKIEAVKLLTGGDIDGRVVSVLNGMGTKFILARLFAKFSEKKTAVQFVSEVIPSALALYNAGVRWFEVHNEPNLHIASSNPEGMWINWQNGKEFATFFQESVSLLRQAMPNANFGFPGLSPGHDVANIRYASDRFLTEADTAIRQADFVCVHAYWNTAVGLPYSAAISQVDAFCRKYPTKIVLLTEFSNSGSTPVAQKGQEYVQFYASMQSLPANLGASFCYLLSSSGGGTEVWRGTSIPEIVGSRSGGTQPVPTITTYKVIASSGLRLREFPNLQSRTLVILPYGTLVTPIAGTVLPGWQKVKTTSGLVGYCSLAYLQKV